MWRAKSTTLLEYPHSLSYQLTTLWKLGLSPIPALASKIDECESCRKSEETTESSVYPRIPFKKQYFIFLYFKFVFGGMFNCFADIIIRSFLLGFKCKIDNRNVNSWDSESHTTQFSLKIIIKIENFYLQCRKN